MKFVLAALTLTPLLALADETSSDGKIKNVMKGQKKVVVEWSSNPPPKDTTVIFTSEKNESCEGNVQSVSKNSTIVSLADCDIMSDLKVGTVAKSFSLDPKSIPVTDLEVKKEPEIPQKKPLRFGVGIFHSSANQLK